MPTRISYVDFLSDNHQLLSRNTRIHYYLFGTRLGHVCYLVMKMVLRFKSSKYSSYALRLETDILSILFLLIYLNLFI